MARLPRRGKRPPQSQDQPSGFRNGLRRFGERFLAQYGVGESDFSRGGVVRGKLGLFGSATNTSTNTADPTVPAGPIKTPRRVSKRGSPTLSTIVDQLNDLIAQANKIGVVTEDQQKELAEQVKQARRITREQAGKNHATPLGAGPGNQPDLQPLDDMLAKLAKTIKKLSRAVDKKNDESNEESTFLQRLAGQYGMEDEFLQSREKRKKRRAARGPRLTRSASSPTGYRVARGQAGAGRIARAPTGGAAIGNATRNLLSSMGGALRRDGARAGGQSIRSIAGPIIRKGLGKTAVKAIPVVGGLVGVAFAIERLVRGDPVGAGIELTSGLGSVATAIPAFALSVARDSYAAKYGIQPEQDPEVATRMPALVKEVEGLIKEELGASVVDPKQKAIPTQPTSVTPPPAATQQSAPPPISPPKIPQTVGGSNGAAGPAPNVGSQSSGSGVGAGGTAPDASAESSTSEHGPLSPVIASPQTLSGVSLMAINAEGDSPNEAFVYAPGFSASVGRYMPQMQTTFGQGRSGMGNVPDPNYPRAVKYASEMFFDPQGQLL